MCYDINNIKIHAWGHMKKNFIAYQGLKYTLEWYYNDRGDSKAFQYYEELTADRQRKILHLFNVLGNLGKIPNEEKFTH